MAEPSPPDEFERACDQAGVAPGDRLALRRLLESWHFPPRRGTALAALLEDFGHWRLYQASRTGDGDAARRFEAHWRGAARTFLGRGFTAEQVDELAALFFERVYSRIHDFAWTTPFAVYLRTVLLNLARDEIRRLRRSRVRELSLDQTVEPGTLREPRDPAPSAEALVLEGERRSALERALARLAPIDRQLVVATATGDRSGAELAAALGVRPAALHQRVHRARQRLRRLVEDELSGRARRDVSRDGGKP